MTAPCFLGLSTGNPNKKKEIETMLKASSLPLTVYAYYDIIGYKRTVVEDGKTYEDNARKKVDGLPLLKTTIWLGDDSGIEVDALQGQPGIYSARYGGEDLSDKDRCLYMLDQLGDTTQRQARFVCVLVIKTPQGDYRTVKGVLEGTISKTYKGDQGFGYDPFFIPYGYT